MKNLSWLATLGIVLIGIPIAIAHGLALSLLWGWFVVPVFHVAELSIPVAMGVYIIAALLTHQHINSSDDFEECFKTIIEHILKPFIAIAFGYLYLQFI